MGTKFRHEWKHEITYSDRICIRQRLRAIAGPDPHAINGIYEIRSLYFDNLYDKDPVTGTSPYDAGGL